MKTCKTITKTMVEATKYSCTMGINSLINNDKCFKGRVEQSCIINISVYRLDMYSKNRKTPINQAGDYVYSETIF